MKTTLHFCGGSLLIAILLCCGCRKSATPASPPVGSIHFTFIGEARSTTRSETNVSEMWQKGRKVRIERGDGEVIIRADPYEYQYKKQQNRGLRVTRKAKNNAVISPVDEALERVKRIKSGGKLVRVETVDGVQCDRYEREDGKLKSTLWLSQTNGFPVKIVDEIPGGGSTSIFYKNVEINIELPDELFMPPNGVKFDEVSD